MHPMIMFLILVSIALGAVSGIAYGSITLDNNRREYAYCPITPETLSSKVSIEVNGCPLARLYINNWNDLSSLEQTTLDNQLRAMGFKDIGELDARTK